jgi:AbrB family looped-hinge helix DNA binding protein
MQTIRMSSKNQIVLPKQAREAMKLKGRDELLVVVKGAVTILMPKPASYKDELAGTGKGLYRKSYLGKERKAW